MTIGEKIKNARKEKGISQDELANLLGTTRVAISNYENNRNSPTYANVLKISKILNVELANSSEKPVKLVPVLGNASCGSLEPSIHEDFISRKAAYNGEFWTASLYCVIANGESMSPEIDDGDEVIIDPDVKPVSGDMVYYKIDDECAIKVLYEDKEAYILQFIPYNQTTEFKIKTIRMDDEETMNRLTIHKVVSVNKLMFNNRSARLKLIGRN